MTVQSAQSVTVLFSTRVFSTGVGTIADSLPTGTLYLNGSSNAATVTVTNISGGLYKAQVTMPTLAINDQVGLAITATVSSVTDTSKIWGDSKDVLLDASGDVTFNNTSIATVTTVTTTTNLTNAPTAGDFTAAMKTSLNASTPASVTTVIGNVLGSTGSVVGSVGSVTAAVTVSGTSALTESYAAQGAALTLAQALYGINQFLWNHTTAGTVWTVQNRSNTPVKTATLDSSTAPTQLVEAT